MVERVRNETRVNPVIYDADNYRARLPCFFFAL